MNKLGKKVSAAWVAVILVLVVLIVLLAVLPGNKNTGKTIDNKEPIRLGLMGPLTGEAASWGQNALAATTLAVKEINEAGGINGRMIEIYAEDDKCTADSVNAITKLINIDQVDVIVGPVCSSSAGPAMPIVQQNEIPVIMWTVSAPKITEIGDNIFRIYPTDTFQGKVGAELIYNELGKKKVAVIYVKNEWGEGLQEYFDQTFTSLGGEIVYKTSVLQKETDFKTEISKIKESGAEAIYAALYPNTGISFSKQMNEMGVSLPVVGGDALSGEEVVTSGYTEGLIVTVPKVDTPEELKTKLKELPGFESLQVSFVAPLAYDAANMMALAIGRSEDKGTEIKEEIAKMSYKGISNPIIEFDEVGDLKTVIFDILIVKDNEAVLYEA